MAQRISWANGWSVLFHDATVWQERNQHNLLKDFEDEIPGYLNNYKICSELSNLNIKGGKENMLDDFFAFNCFYFKYKGTSFIFANSARGIILREEGKFVKIFMVLNF